MNKTELTIFFFYEKTEMRKLDCMYAELDESGRFLIATIERENAPEFTRCFNTKYIAEYSLIERED